MTEPLQGLEPHARARFKQAADALTAGKPRDAETWARELCEQHPNQPDVLHLLAATRARLGDPAGALAAIRRALTQRPDDASFHCLLGNQLAATGQLDAALDALQRACALQPGLAMAWYNLGVLQVRAVYFDEAATSLRHALEMTPDDLRVRLQLADVLKMDGRTDDAVAIYREALAARPACGDAWWGLANIPSALGNDAIPAMQAAVGDPRASERDRIALGFAMARVLDRNDRCNEAMGVLKETHAQHRFEDLAAFWNDFDRAVRGWRERLPGFVYEQNYEDLLADPEQSVRALLAFCGLPFESDCLEFHRNAREVRSPSAAQVRERLRGDTARATRYGSLLDPLRHALGMVDIVSWH